MDRRRAVLADEAEELLDESLLSAWLVQLGYVEGFQLHIVDCHVDTNVSSCVSLCIRRFTPT